MNELSINLENCYGIEKLNEEFDFSTKSTNAVYARNGLMKTSLTKVFKMIQDDKKNEIKDLIFERTPVVCEIKVDGNDILKEEIFVIKSFENAYESDSVASLLINNELKQQLDEVLNLKDKFFKLLERLSGMKIFKTSAGKRKYELEPTLIQDFKFIEQSFLLNINVFNIEEINYEFLNIKYATIFNDTALKKINSNDFQSKIDDFLIKSEEIYQEFNFLDKGNFTLPKLKEIKKGLEKNGFFVKDNKVLLHGELTISSINELNDKIIDIENRLQDTNEFKEIEKLLSDVAGRDLKDIIENNPEIVKELKLHNLDNFKKKLWLSYIKSEIVKFEELKVKYQQLEKEIEKTNIDETSWKESIKIFNNRFIVPFNMEISNLKSTIIGESVPKIAFSFCKDGNSKNLDVDNWVKLDRDELEGKDTLSQGERRALYLLNIIFDIQKRKNNNQKTLFIIDDIADSFDYKNKYAIVEYLKEISEENNFYMLILSHNFDFYRTVSSRLDVGRKNRFIAVKDAIGIQVEREYYQKEPFKIWIDQLNKKNIIALIPFIRNLIEFGIDRKVNNYVGIDEDYMFLTNLLHLKNATIDITVAQLKKVYKEYIGSDKVLDDIRDEESVFDILLDVANSITSSDTRLENKVILSIAIRLMAEKFMKEQISQSTNAFRWIENKMPQSGSGNIFLSFIDNVGNQTRELYKGYYQIGCGEKVKTLDNVNTMTPETIHLNSFMYEPILDMDIIELKNLYNKVIRL